MSRSQKFHSFITSHSAIAHIRCIYNNLGDIAVSNAINRLLSNVTLIDYSYRSRLKTVERLFNKKLFKYACLGSGTLIFAPTNVGWFLSLKDAVNRRIKLLFTFGTGVRDPDFFQDISDEGISQWCEYLNNFSLISVRGNLSCEILEKNGMKNVKVIGDPALLYSREHIKPKSHSKKIGINIAGDNISYAHDDEKTFETIVNFIKRLAEDKWEITLFPACEDDLVTSERIQRRLTHRNIRLHRRFLDVESFLNAVEEQDIFVGMKLHSVILAFCAYTPSFMLAYQPKCYDFIQTMQMGEFIMRNDSLNLDNLIERARFLYSNIEIIQERQYKSCQEFKRRLISFRNEVYNAMEKE